MDQTSGTSLDPLVDRATSMAPTTQAPISQASPSDATTAEHRGTYSSGRPNSPSPMSFSDEERPLQQRESTYQPLPPLPPQAAMKRDTTNGEVRVLSPSGNRSEVDWIVPTKHNDRVKTVGERLQPTLSTAQAEHAKSVRKAIVTGYALNIALGLQILLGALTTGLSAALTGRTTSIVVSLIGGLSTLVASYLARVRGSNEPETSKARAKALAQFIRECQAFQMDHGHASGHDHDGELDRMRNELEELLGNENREKPLTASV